MRQEGTGPMRHGRLFVYDDATGLELKPGDQLTGKLTIGFGRNVTDMGVTKDEALLLLQNDIDRVAGELRTALPWFGRIDAVRQDALIDMGFNLGVLTGDPPKLLRFHGTLDCMERGDWEGACQHLQQTPWRQQVGRRAEIVMQMIRTGQYPEEGV